MLFRAVFTKLTDKKIVLNESEQLDKRIQRDFLENANKNFINALDALLPKKIVPVIVRLTGIKPSTKVNQVTKEMRAKLVNILKDFKVTSFMFVSSIYMSHPESDEITSAILSQSSFFS